MTPLAIATHLLPGKNNSFLGQCSVSVYSRRSGEMRRRDNTITKFPFGNPSGVPIVTSKILQLKLKKLPEKVRRAFRVKNAPHNLVAVAELVDTGCGVYLYDTGFEIGYSGEIIYRGWRDLETRSRLWK